MTLRSATKSLLRIFEDRDDSAIFEYEGLLLPNAIRSLRFAKADKARKIIEDEWVKGRIVKLRKLYVNWKTIFWRRSF